jgi:hypothetical protein
MCWCRPRRWERGNTLLTTWEQRWEHRTGEEAGERAPRPGRLGRALAPGRPAARAALRNRARGARLSTKASPAGRGRAAQHRTSVSTKRRRAPAGATATATRAAGPRASGASRASAPPRETASRRSPGCATGASGVVSRLTFGEFFPDWLRNRKPYSAQRDRLRQSQVRDTGWSVRRCSYRAVFSTNGPRHSRDNTVTTNVPPDPSRPSPAADQGARA